MTPLRGLLEELEATWERKGWDQPQVLRPGLPADLVRGSLAGLTQGRLPGEILDWFGWHDGQIAPAQETLLAPSTFWPLGLEAAVWASQYLACAAETTVAQLAGNPPGVPTDPAYFWERSWLPLGFREVSWLVADLATESETVAVREVQWDDDDFRIVRADSLASLVRIWLDVPNEYWSWSSEEGRWLLRPSVLPMHMLTTRLF